MTPLDINKAEKKHTASATAHNNAINIVGKGANRLRLILEILIMLLFTVGGFIFTAFLLELIADVGYPGSVIAAAVINDVINTLLFLFFYFGIMLFIGFVNSAVKMQNGENCRIQDVFSAFARKKTAKNLLLSLIILLQIASIFLIFFLCGTGINALMKIVGGFGDMAEAGVFILCFTSIATLMVNILRIFAGWFSVVVISAMLPQYSLPKVVGMSKIITSSHRKEIVMTQIKWLLQLALSCFAVLVPALLIFIPNGIVEYVCFTNEMYTRYIDENLHPTEKREDKPKKNIFTDLNKLGECASGGSVGMSAAIADSDTKLSELMIVTTENTEGIRI